MHRAEDHIAVTAAVVGLKAQHRHHPCRRGLRDPRDAVGGSLTCQHLAEPGPGGPHLGGRTREPRPVGLGVPQLRGMLIADTSVLQRSRQGPFAEARLTGHGIQPDIDHEIRPGCAHLLDEATQILALIPDTDDPT